jgi:hypothetical protein
MSGTDKIKLQVSGDRTNPQCFKGLGMGSLSARFYANKNLWMPSEGLKKQEVNKKATHNSFIHCDCNR